MNYTGTELLWLFLIYSFLGWAIEAAVGSAKNRKFVNRGFSTGPYCLVYGVAAVLMTVTLSELKSNLFFLFVFCGVQATVIEWFTGKFLERLNHNKWWDYSNKKFNFDGYICLQYSLLWAALGTFCIHFGTPALVFVFDLIPEPVRTIVLWAACIIIALDVGTSFLAVFHLRKDAPDPIATGRKFIDSLRNFFLTGIGFVERRMIKAYPVIEQKAELASKDGRFAEGCGFYKLVWLYVIGCLLGDITETIFCRITAGEWMSRSSLVWGPFSIVWGMAIVLATVLLYKDREKADRHIFIVGTLLGGAYEYACSVLTEIFFGRVFWDYSKIPFNLGGRINLLYCFFWGIAAVVWIKGLYPKFSGWIEKIPKVTGYILTWILVVFMAADMLVSAAALIRYDARSKGDKADNVIEYILDDRFDDERMERIYPNAIEK
ncbi:putative ABC transporter permease [Ruminococcus sp. CLA-AA-H200]|uniref:ABC transporter permease n=1 Tax=Ruminococcus turbiniformis TaxID=2881258 RepID=A0ABS8G1M7_9FIRM|nr:putative ABC transporter permease [Ruminococcus turbiniformis]MCC2256212.1 putative ABC transporter permease [Ruminococcus turbiniformis]